MLVNIIQQPVLESDWARDVPRVIWALNSTWMFYSFESLYHSNR